MCLLQPAQLLPVWTIGENAEHVPLHGPVDNPMNSVEQVVRAGEMTGRLVGGPQYQTRNRLCAGIVG
jgi:hypothetical protein